jgi:hypothetical protein
MLIRTANGIVFTQDWDRDRIGTALKRIARTTSCDAFVQDVFCRPHPPQPKAPQPVEASPYMDRLVRLFE